MSFDPLAKHYRWLEVILAGGVLQRCRTAFIPEVFQTRHALLLGEGNGRFLAPFLEVNQSVQVVCVDESLRMIDEARRLLERRGIKLDRVEFIHADLLEWRPPSATFDLIVTHFFLDCFTAAQLQSLIPGLAAAGKPHCRWLLADFQVPAKGIARVRAQLVHQLMYAFFRIMTDLPARRLTPPAALLREAGFVRFAQVTAQFGLIHSDCWVRSEIAPPPDRIQAS